MAIKTFTTGEVLTASDTNTYLANSGLVYVTSTAISGSSVSINSCFTSTYENYKMLFRIATSSADPEIRMTLRLAGTDSTANYYTGVWLADSSGTVNYSNNGAYSRIGIAYTAAANTCSGALDIFGPALAANTSWNGNTSNSTGSVGRTVAVGGAHLVATAYDGLTITAGAGTFTGTLTIMGYRKA
jgi:hypothetical protein